MGRFDITWVALSLPVEHICHRPVVCIQFYFTLPTPSSFSWTWNPASTCYLQICIKFQATFTHRTDSTDFCDHLSDLSARVFFCFIIYHFRILMPCVRLSWLLWAFEFTLNLWTPYLTLSVILFLCGPPVSIVVPAWQCCHHVFLHWAKGRWRLAAGE